MPHISISWLSQNPVVDPSTISGDPLEMVQPSGAKNWVSPMEENKSPLAIVEHCAINKFVLDARAEKTNNTKILFIIFTAVLKFSFDSSYGIFQCNS